MTNQDAADKGKGKGLPPLYFCAEWARDKAATWSGTTWALHEALGRYFDVRDVELSQGRRSLASRALGRLRRKAGRDDFGMAALDDQQRGFDACNANEGSFFQFSEVPAVRAGSRNYVYQDLAVEWLWDCKRDDPTTFAYTGFQNMADKAFAARLARQRAFYKDCAGVFTMGRWMADYLVGECGLPAAKVHHAGGGVNSSASGAQTERHGNTFLFAGRDFVRKGGDLVLEAFRMLHEEDGSLRLVIAGPGEDPAPGMAGVKYVGDVGNQELGDLMATSDVFVMPSRFEAYGLVFPEAMAAGLPCVGRGRFEMPYFIQDGRNGKLVHGDDVAELARAMRECLTSGAIRESAAAGAEEARREFSWDAVAKRIAAVIEGDERDRLERV